MCELALITLPEGEWVPRTHLEGNSERGARDISGDTSFVVFRMGTGLTFSHFVGKPMC